MYVYCLVAQNLSKIFVIISFFIFFSGYSEIGWVPKHCKEQQANVQNECLKKVKIHPPNVYCDEVMEDLGKC